MEKFTISTTEKQGGCVRWAVSTQINLSMTVKFPAVSLMGKAVQVYILPVFFIFLSFKI